MPAIVIKILGIATATLIGLVTGGIGGIIMSYILATSKPGFSFNYRLAFLFGTIFGVYGLVSSIRELWLR
jgi:hypothetical protein